MIEARLVHQAARSTRPDAGMTAGRAVPIIRVATQPMEGHPS